MKVTVKNGVGVFVKAFKGNLEQALDAGVLKCAQVAAGEIRRTILATFKGRTGNLARSFRETFLGSAKTGVASAGALSDSVYAEIQDAGGTVRPKRKYLAIPVPSANVPYGKWPRDYAKGELRFKRGRGDSALLVDRAGKPIFALKKQVRITGRSYLATAAEASQPKLAEVMGQNVQVAVGRSAK